jgi:hypothetical protein
MAKLFTVDQLLEQRRAYREAFLAMQRAELKKFAAESMRRKAAREDRAILRAGQKVQLQLNRKVD